MTNDELLKRLFYLSKELIEKHCYDVDEDMKHAYCKECGLETGAGAVYQHKTGCKVGDYNDLLGKIEPRI